MSSVTLSLSQSDATLLVFALRYVVQDIDGGELDPLRADRDALERIAVSIEAAKVGGA